MPSTPIDTHDISEGIDREQLKRVETRFLELNQQRYQRTSAALSERQQQFLALLPLLFHVNHPMLPGYISHQTACGICNYTPEKSILQVARVFARSFKLNHDVLARQPAIDAIFVMGSIGTIAHSETSDLDVWVCHSPELSEQKRIDLNEKCERISQWAEKNIRLEIHFFLMESRQFRSDEASVLSSEDSGSAQRFLLLDEFYRTALWLAGKLPLWWFVPASQEHNYASYSETLLRKYFLRGKDVIDFGGIPTIPAREFPGAGIWQVYKGIESPYKSILKLVLLEAYANETQSEPLALTLKRAVYESAPDPNQLDPYVMIYQRLEEYLNRRKQTQRLELIRRCFYFKVNKPLTRVSRGAQKSWQRLLLEQLTSSWGWKAHHLHLLDSRPLWKAPVVINERSLLVNELSNSYRLLREIHQKSSSETAISAEDLIILGRKLHAAFERKAGKIEWINPGISDDLHELSLCLVEEHEPKNNLSYWELYRDSAVKLQQAISPKPAKRSRHLLELLLWCYCNGLLTPSTKVDILSKQVALNLLQQQQLLQVLYQWLPLPLPPVAHERFTVNALPTRVLLIINLGFETQTELRKKGLQMLSSQQDALGYSGFRENLVLATDIVQYNSWHEVICRHYSNDALINSLLYCLRLARPGQGKALPELTVRCFSAGQGNAIALRVEQLWQDLVACFYTASSAARARNPRYLLEVGDEYLMLQFLQHQPQITRYKNYAQLLQRLAMAQPAYSSVVIDRYGLHDKSLNIVFSKARSPGIHVFYHIDPLAQSTQQDVELSIIDERGSLFSTSMVFHNQQTLLRPLYRFIRTVMERQNLSEISLQQSAAQTISFYEIMGKVSQRQGYAETRSVDDDISQLAFTQVQAIAESDSDGEFHFNIYCGDQEFSALELGDNLFSHVARYILDQRQQGEKYPCYITDLDLSECSDLIAPQTGLQLIHFLQIKADLEQRLTHALKNL